MNDKKHLKPGEIIPGFEVTSVTGKKISVPNPSVRYVHLQFRRFAGCPLCNTHLRTFIRRKDALAEAGIHEIVFFHSSASEIIAHESELPLDFIADPEKRYYRQFGAEVSWRALLSLAVAGALSKALFQEKWVLPKAENGRLGLPADILLDRLGRVVAVKYGVHAYDQWEFDELMELVGAAGTDSFPARTSIVGNSQ